MKNCKEIEREIYLYDELTIPEKAIVDEHVQQCATCQKLFEVVQSHQAIIHSAGLHKPQPENYSRLTSNIMQAIDATASQNKGISFFERLFVRYALAAVSLVLIISFLVEQTEPTTSQPAVSLTVQSKTVALKTSGVLQDLRKKKEAKPFENITSLYACVKSGNCSNPLSKTLN